MIDSKQNDDKILISWTAPEFIRYEKGRGWYIGLGFISLALIIIALFMQNYLFALIIAMAAFLIYVQAVKRPKEITFIISGEGITINDKTYPISDIRSFWIFEEPELRYISLLSKRLTQPHMSLPLADQDPQSIRRALLNFIQEKKQEETFSEIIVRKIRF